MTIRLIEGRPSMTPKRACEWLRRELDIPTSPSSIRRMCDAGELRHQLIERKTANGTRIERHTIDRWLLEAFVVDSTAPEDRVGSAAATIQDEEERTAVALAEIAALRKGGRR